MAGIEVDGLEYDAEVAYITATSPVPTNPGNRASKASFSEFEFGEVDLHEQPQISSTTTEQHEPPKAKAKSETSPEKSKPTSEDEQAKARKTNIHPPLISVTTSPHSDTIGGPLSPLLTPPHYTLDTELSTPKGKLRQIQEAQASPPSPKPSTPKFQAELESAQYQYKTVVVYGQAGCGKTNFVEKLVHSNPVMFTKVVSNTTRKKRVNEVAGIDFHYISQKEMSLGIGRGDYLEYIQLQKRPKKKMKRAFTSDQDFLMKNMTKLAERRLTTAEIPKEEVPAVSLQPTQRSSSKFDLLEEDSPLIGGEFIGTTKQALVEATQQGKPCVVLNVSVTGAQQLKRKGVKATYILIHSGTKLPKQSEVKPDFVVNASDPNEAYKQLQEYVMQLIEGLQLTQTTRYEITKHEWDSLPTVKLETTTEPGMPQVQARPVSFSEVLAHFQTVNLKKEKELAKLDTPKEGLFSRTKLNKKLHEERILVLAMASCSLTEKDKVHLRMLQTIYTRLTSRNISCRRFGAHWKSIGFSGVDPADDLHSVGVFGLSQLVYFLDNPKTIALAQEIYRYTKQASHATPFCSLSFEITKIALSALREGLLTKLANKRDQVFVVVNDFYVAVFYHYYSTLKAHGTPMLDSAALTQTISEYACKHIREILRNYEDYMSMKEHSKQAPAKLVESTPKAFTPLEDYSDV